MTVADEEMDRVGIGSRTAHRSRHRCDTRTRKSRPLVDNDVVECRFEAGLRLCTARERIAEGSQGGVAGDLEPASPQSLDHDRGKCRSDAAYPDDGNRAASMSIPARPALGRLRVAVGIEGMPGKTFGDSEFEFPSVEAILQGEKGLSKAFHGLFTFDPTGLAFASIQEYVGRGQRRRSRRLPAAQAGIEDRLLDLPRRDEPAPRLVEIG